MTLPSDQSGFTVFEAMLSLALLSLILTVAVVVARPPSPALQAEALASDLTRSAVTLRAEAIASNKTKIWTPEDAECEEDIKPLVRFFSDGSASGSDLCIGARRLRPHPLTGLLLTVAE
jgi:type II secretory pathway component PulJ